MKDILAAVFLSTLVLSACTGLADRNPPANPFPRSTDQGIS